MPQDQLTPSEADQIAAGVAAALAPTFERLAAALAAPPKPVPTPTPMPTLPQPAAAPALPLAQLRPSIAPIDPRAHAELEQENAILRGILAAAEQEIKRLKAEPR